MVDGYGTHDTVILDDFRGDCMRLTDLQRLLDWYPLWVEIKGGSLPMLATRYVITSNQHPADWYTRGDPMGRSSGASGTSPRPMGGSWSSPEQGDRDREPSLRWMAPYRLSKLDWIGLLGFCGSSGVILYPELLAGTLAAKALMFAKSVPLRPGVTRVPRTCYGFCVRGLCGATTRLVPLARRWLRSGVIRSPLRPDCLYRDRID